MPNESSRPIFTAAVLLLLVAGLAGWIAYSGANLTIGVYEVPALMSWITAAVFCLVGLLAMRAAHIIRVLPTVVAG